MRRLYDGNIQDLDLFMDEMSDDGSEAYKDSVFNRDEEDFGMG